MGESENGEPVRPPEFDQYGLEDTGIYKRWNGPSFTAPGMTVAPGGKLVPPKPSLSLDLEFVRQKLSEYVAPFRLDKGQMGAGELLRVDFGDGPDWQRFDDAPMDEIVYTALVALRCVERVASGRSILHRLVSDSLLPGEAFSPGEAERWLDTLALDAWELGKLCERVGVLPFEPMVASRKASTNGLAQARRARSDTKKKKQKHQRAVAALAEAQREYPDRGLTVQKEKAAKSLGIGRTTLDKHLKSG
ncbi:hypothetical protein [Botrimarina sp.]|uniref:hypothetical protein n=1 Tax=Botrimarina sp. TaxID=2795802 RepID=UPI0032EE2816